MARIQWGRKTPGFLVFLVDQSGSMSSMQNHLKVAKAIHDAIFECYSSCIDGETVKARFALSIIGYGDDVKEMWSGFINDEKLSEKLIEANDNGTPFFPAVASGTTPMAEAFELAYTTIQKWFADLADQKSKEQINAIPAPIVINITDGFPDYEPTATAAAQKVMDLKGDDGNVILFNLHISARDSKELLFPMTEADLDGTKEARFLFNISSELEEDMVNNAYASGFEKVKAGAHGMITNASGDTIPKFISFGSQASQVVNN